jgi:cysteinyl-tRNA synthetase
MPDSNPANLTLFDSYKKHIMNVSSDKNTIKMYSCGPTVYQYQHIGNMRAVWLPDMFNRVAKMSGYKTEWVLNITDVGHLVGDGDDGINTMSGEDKLEKSAKKEGKTVEEIVEFYLSDYHHQCDLLNIKLPQNQFQPKATEYIQEQMMLCLILLHQKKAYLLPDGIYFDSQKNSDLDLPFEIVRGDHAFTGREIENSTKNPADFALWKFVDEDSLQKWKFNEFDETANLMIQILQNIEDQSFMDLPNRYGCPGWHSECVAMICKIVSGSFPPSSSQTESVINVHFGGEDHIDIHHKNEILQSEALGFHLSDSWVHNKFVLVDGKKMSKSIGNVFLVGGKKSETGFESLIEKGFSSISYRMMLMEHHYTQQLDFTWEKLAQSQARLYGLRKDIARIVSFAHEKNIEIIIDRTQITHSVELLLKPLQENLNIPKFLEKYQNLVGDVLGEILQKNTLHPKNLMTILYFENELLNFDLNPEIPLEITELAALRAAAKQEKNFAKSDEIRNQLLEKGWNIDDNSWGYSLWSIK